MGSFARVEGGQVWAYDLDIKPYEKASHEQHQAKRSRRLLLHRKEIDRLFGLTQVKGNALVILRMYWKGARVKVELGVASGKERADQRADLKERVERRETDRLVAAFNRSRGV
jgi:SsrA-binding protein